MSWGLSFLGSKPTPKQGIQYLQTRTKLRKAILSDQAPRLLADPQLLPLKPEGFGERVPQIEHGKTRLSDAGALYLGMFLFPAWASY